MANISDFFRRVFNQPDPEDSVVGNDFGVRVNVSGQSQPVTEQKPEVVSPESVVRIQKDQPTEQRPTVDRGPTRTEFLNPTPSVNLPSATDQVKQVFPTVTRDNAIPYKQPVFPEIPPSANPIDVSEFRLKVGAKDEFQKELVTEYHEILRMLDSGKYDGEQKKQLELAAQWKWEAIATDLNNYDGVAADVASGFLSKFEKDQPKQGGNKWYDYVLFADLFADPSRAGSSSKLLPFVGPALNYMDQRRFHKALEDGTLDETEQILAKSYLQRQVADGQINNIAYRVGQAVAEMPPWMVEYWAMNSATAGIRTGLFGALTKGKEVGFVGRLAAGTPSLLAQSSAVAAMNVPRLLDTAMGYQLPEAYYEESEVANEIKIMLEKKGDSLAKALAKSYGVNLVEFFSEGLGDAGGREVSNLISRMELGVIGRWGDKLFGRAFFAGTEGIKDIAAKTGFDGFVWEVFEEEFAEALQAPIEGREYDLPWTEKGKERLLVESAAIALLGAAFGAAKIGGGIRNSLRVKLQERAQNKPGTTPPAPPKEGLVPQEQATPPGISFQAKVKEMRDRLRGQNNTPKTFVDTVAQASEELARTEGREPDTFSEAVEAATGNLPEEERVPSVSIPSAELFSINDNGSVSAVTTGFGSVLDWAGDQLSLISYLAGLGIPEAVKLQEDYDPLTADAKIAEMLGGYFDAIRYTGEKGTQEIMDMATLAYYQTSVEEARKLSEQGMTSQAYSAGVVRKPVAVTSATVASRRMAAESTIRRFASREELPIEFARLMFARKEDGTLELDSQGRPIRAWGAYNPKTNTITLSDTRRRTGGSTDIPDTARHELGEWYWHNKVDKARQKEILSELRRSDPRYKNLTNDQLKEVLMDRFAEFRRGNRKGVTGKLLDLFEEILAFARKVAGISESKVNALMREIEYRQRPGRAEAEAAEADEKLVSDMQVQYQREGLPVHGEFERLVLRAMNADLFAKDLITKDEVLAFLKSKEAKELGITKNEARFIAYTMEKNIKTDAPFTPDFLKRLLEGDLLSISLGSVRAAKGSYATYGMFDSGEYNPSATNPVTPWIDRFDYKNVDTYAVNANFDYSNLPFASQGYEHWNTWKGLAGHFRLGYMDDAVVGNEREAKMNRAEAEYLRGEASKVGKIIEAIDDGSFDNVLVSDPFSDWWLDNLPVNLTNLITGVIPSWKLGGELNMGAIQTDNSNAARRKRSLFVFNEGVDTESQYLGIHDEARRLAQEELDAIPDTPENEKARRDATAKVVKMNRSYEQLRGKLEGVPVGALDKSETKNRLKIEMNRLLKESESFENYAKTAEETLSPMGEQTVAHVVEVQGDWTQNSDRVAEAKGIIGVDKFNELVRRIFPREVPAEQRKKDIEDYIKEIARERKVVKLAQSLISSPAFLRGIHPFYVHSTRSLRVVVKKKFPGLSGTEIMQVTSQVESVLRNSSGFNYTPTGTVGNEPYVPNTIKIAHNKKDGSVTITALNGDGATLEEKWFPSTMKTDADQYVRKLEYARSKNLRYDIIGRLDFSLRGVLRTTENADKSWSYTMPNGEVVELGYLNLFLDSAVYRLGEKLPKAVLTVKAIKNLLETTGIPGEVIFSKELALGYLEDKSRSLFDELARLRSQKAELLSRSETPKVARGIKEILSAREENLKEPFNEEETEKIRMSALVHLAQHLAAKEIYLSLENDKNWKTGTKPKMLGSVDLAKIRSEDGTEFGDLDYEFDDSGYFKSLLNEKVGKDLVERVARQSFLTYLDEVELMASTNSHGLSEAITVFSNRSNERYGKADALLSLFKLVGASSQDSLWRFVQYEKTWYELVLRKAIQTAARGGAKFLRLVDPFMSTIVQNHGNTRSSVRGIYDSLDYGDYTEINGEQYWVGEVTKDKYIAFSRSPSNNFSLSGLRRYLKKAYADMTSGEDTSDIAKKLAELIKETSGYKRFASYVERNYDVILAQKKASAKATLEVYLNRIDEAIARASRDFALASEIKRFVAEGTADSIPDELKQFADRKSFLSEANKVGTFAYWSDDRTEMAIVTRVNQAEADEDVRVKNALDAARRFLEINGITSRTETVPSDDTSFGGKLALVFSASSFEGRPFDEANMVPVVSMYMKAGELLNELSGVSDEIRRNRRLYEDEKSLSSEEKVDKDKAIASIMASPSSYNLGNMEEESSDESFDELTKNDMAMLMLISMASHEDYAFAHLNEPGGTVNVWSEYAPEIEVVPMLDINERGARKLADLRRTFSVEEMRDEWRINSSYVGIHARYETEFPDYLKTLRGKENVHQVIDEFGLRWTQIELDDSDKGPVTAYQAEEPMGARYSPKGLRSAAAFNNSANQKKVTNLGGTSFVIGTWGRNHFDDKKVEGKRDRFPIEELRETLRKVRSAYRASPDETNWRYDNIVWNAVMPDGELRSVITRLNRFGEEEILTWHRVPDAKKADYLEQLASHGVPPGTRTQTTRLEDGGTIQLSERDKGKLLPEDTFVKAAFGGSRVATLPIGPEGEEETLYLIGTDENNVPLTMKHSGGMDDLLEAARLWQEKTMTELSEATAFEAITLRGDVEAGTVLSPELISLNGLSPSDRVSAVMEGDRALAVGTADYTPIVLNEPGIIDFTVKAIEEPTGPVPLARRTPTQLALDRSLESGIPVNRITQTEKALLSKRIRDFARGVKAGRSDMRRDLTAAMRMKIRELETLRKAVAAYANASLSPKGRGRYLNMVATAKTQRDLIKAMERIDVAADKETVRYKVSELARKAIAVRKAAKSGRGIAVDYTKRILALLDAYDFQTPTQKTVEALQGLQAYIESHPDLNVPERLQEALRRLTKTPLRSLTAGELDELNETVGRLIDLGRLKLRLVRYLDEQKRDAMVERLVAATTSLGGETKPGEKGKSVLRSLRYAHFASMHFFRVTDALDGLKGYMGANTGLQRHVANAETRAKVAIMESEEKIREGIKAIKEDWSEADNIAMTYWMDVEMGADSQAEALLEAYGLTAPPQKTFEIAAAMDFIRSTFEERIDELEAVYEEMENKPFVRVGNYFPLKYERGENSFIDEPTIGQDTRTAGRKTQQGFTKSRLTGVRKLQRTDWLNVALEATDEQLWYMHVQPALNNVHAVVSDRRYAKAAGPIAMKLWEQWMGAVAAKGRQFTDHVWLRQARFNVGTAVMGFKLTSIIVQPLAIAEALAFTASMPMRKGSKTLAVARMTYEFLRAWLNPLAYRDEKAASDMLRLREGGDFAVQEGLQRLSGDDGTWISRALRQYQRFAYSAIKYTDLKTATGVRSAFKRILRGSGMDEASSDLHADLLMNVVSGSSEVSDQPLVISRGGEGAKMFLQFKNFALNSWGLLLHDITYSAMKRGGVDRKLGALIGFGIIALGRIVADLLRDLIYTATTGNEPKGQSDYLWDFLLVLPESVPFAGDMARSLRVYGQGGIDAPVLRTAENVFVGINGMRTAKTDETYRKNAMKAAEGLMMLGGVAGTAQGFDLMERYVVPASKLNVRSRPSRPAPERPTRPKRTR